jgi:hypothetical protein
MSERLLPEQPCAGFKYLALIQGGIGPDVWDKEKEIFAADFIDAANQSTALAQELGGQVVSLDQNDYPQPEWRCFHCNAVFSDKAKAREHFGEMQFVDGAVKWDLPACSSKGGAA